MNPLEWKREHQIALACAVALGCLVGMIAGLLVTPDYVSFRWGKLWCNYGYTCVYLLQGYWLFILLWISLGAVVGAALVYVRQLLRT
jgi:hypothetical protein